MPPINSYVPGKLYTICNDQPGQTPWVHIIKYFLSEDSTNKWGRIIHSNFGATLNKEEIDILKQGNTPFMFMKTHEDINLAGIPIYGHKFLVFHKICLIDDRDIARQTFYLKELKDSV